MKSKVEKHNKNQIIYTNLNKKKKIVVMWKLIVFVRKNREYSNKKDNYK